MLSIYTYIKFILEGYIYSYIKLYLKGIYYKYKFYIKKVYIGIYIYMYDFFRGGKMAHERV